MVSAKAVQRLCRPGFGLPVNWKPTTGTPLGKHTAGIAYPNAVLNWTVDLMTVRERNMLKVMNQLTDKEGWEHKIFNKIIVEKWKKEAVSDPPQLTSWARHTFTNNQGFTPKMFDFCISELRDKAELYKKTKVVRILDTAAAVAKSDIAVSPKLRNEIAKHVSELLEDVPDHLKDWHPGSNEQVLDLVHPSLFPMVSGRTRILPNSTIELNNCMKSIGSGEIIPVPPDSEGLEDDYVNNTMSPHPEKLWSTKFQWLPCDVDFLANGGVKIKSYINNLHPVAHKALYPFIERVIDAAVPLWDEVLGFIGTDLLKTHYRRIPVMAAEYDFKGDIEVEEENEDWSLEQYKENYDSNRTLLLPEPPDYTEDNMLVSATSHKDHLRRAFESKGLQVIVKLADIVLTPEKPEYPGGSWHVEGQLNERICATAIYYYDNDNVTDSYLAFRQRVDTYGPEENAEQQDDFGGLEFLFDITQSESAVQDIGHVKTCAGRLIAFPNVVQHRVSPFALQDRTKPGHRKIIALFLVDPHTRIISTANVPPQRKDWLPEVFGAGSASRGGEDWPMGLEEARMLREELMEERRVYRPLVEDVILGEQFGFCEH
ncbi:hypothetical protein C8R43DRAFT_1112609 [Mycena crocata]|nr:hypothetical protein C8R43DRAFT_1112609 [Mycena crocata]